MKSYKIAVLKGDGIGPEIVDEAIKVLDAVAGKEGFNLEYNEYLLGGSAIDVFDNPCPDETIALPPSKYSLYSKLNPSFPATASRTLIASSTISGPIPSPFNTAIL